MVGRLHEGPGQILVAILFVVPAVEFTITELLSADTAGIGGIMARTGKAVDVARLQDNCVGETHG